MGAGPAKKLFFILHFHFLILRDHAADETGPMYDEEGREEVG